MQRNRRFFFASFSLVSASKATQTTEIAGKAVLVGNRRLMDEEKVSLGTLAERADTLKGAGRTVVHVAEGGRILGLIAIADALRPTAKATVAKLRERGVQVAMLTGDNAGTAARIAAELGIDIVLADVLPSPIVRASIVTHSIPASSK